MEQLMKLCKTIHELDISSTYMNQKLIKQYKEQTLHFVQLYLVNDFGDCEDVQNELIHCSKLLDITPSMWSKA